MLELLQFHREAECLETSHTLKSGINQLKYNKGLSKNHLGPTTNGKETVTISPPDPSLLM